MRSVKIDRAAAKPRAPRGGRGSTRAPRGQGAAQRPFGKRTQPSNNIIFRTFRAIGSWFALRRLMFTLTAGLMAAVVLVALFVGGYFGRATRALWAAADVVSTEAGFGISEVHLTGNKRTPPETIAAALGFQPGESIFGADIQGARARLLKLDWVAEADVRRRYPDDISVRIVEKLPFALWQSPDGAVYVVERDGGLITREGLSEFKHLPLLLGAGGANASDIVDAVALHRAVFARVRAYQRVSERRWNLILDDAVVVKLPEQNWQREIDVLEQLIIDKGILERDIGEIDLRSPTQYFFVLKNGEKTTVTRGNAA